MSARSAAPERSRVQARRAVRVMSSDRVERTDRRWPDRRRTADARRNDGRRRAGASTARCSCGNQRLRREVANCDGLSSIPFGRSGDPDPRRVERCRTTRMPPGPRLKHRAGVNRAAAGLCPTVADAAHRRQNPTFIDPENTRGLEYCPCTIVLSFDSR